MGCWYWGRYRARRFSLALSLPDTAANRKQAKKLANEIEQDVAAGAFDVTLVKYRPEPKKAQEYQ
ncbi:MAG: Arm DNA-binding domain-containing protein [Pseudanabaenaceae cyanobacterium]